MLEKFYPDSIAKSVYEIDFEKIYKEGKRGIIFDIDNTLVEHGADSNERSEQLFLRLKQIGFRTCLLSNNDEERVTRFNKNIHTDYIYKARKPNKKGYLAAMKKMGTTIEETLCIGDQLFTDIYGAGKIGMDNICVNPISPKESIKVVLKRRLEKLVYRSYNKKHSK